MDEREYFGDICLINRKSHFDYICSSAVVCLFISEKKIESILFANMSDFKSSTNTARLRLKFLLHMKTQMKEKAQRHKGKHKDDEHCTSLKYIPSEMLDTPHQVLETEGEDLLKVSPDPEDIFQTPVKNPAGSMADGEPPSMDKILAAYHVNLEKQLGELKDETVDRMKDVFGKNKAQEADVSIRKKKMALMEVVSKIDIQQGIESSEEEEGEDEPHLEVEEESHNSEHGSEMDDSWEMDDPIASMSFKEMRPELDTATQMVMVVFQSKLVEAFAREGEVIQLHDSNKRRSNSVSEPVRR